MQSKYAAKHEHQVLNEYELIPGHRDKWLAKELVKRVTASYRQVRAWETDGFDRFKLDSKVRYEFSEDRLSILLWKRVDDQDEPYLKIVPRFCMRYGTPEEALDVAYVLAAQPWIYL